MQCLLSEVEAYCTGVGQGAKNKKKITHKWDYTGPTPVKTRVKLPPIWVTQATVQKKSMEHSMRLPPLPGFSSKQGLKERPVQGIATLLDVAKQLKRKASLATVLHNADKEAQRHSRVKPKGTRSKPYLPFTKAEYTRIRGCFEAIDNDGNGSLDWDEMQDLGDLTGLKIDKETFEKLDTDGSGSIDYLEMLRCFFTEASTRDLNWAINKWGGPSTAVVHPTWMDNFDERDAKEILEMYHMFKQPGKTYLRYSDLRKHLSSSISSDFLASVVNEFSPDGRVSPEQFSNMIAAAYQQGNRMLPRLYTVEDVAAKIKDGTIKNIGVLLGAGISVNSGINDFRSAKGLYNTLDVARLSTSAAQQAYIAEEPSRVVSKEVFEECQLPFLEVKRDFSLKLKDKVLKPTASHFMLKLLEEHGLLTKIYTQNVDCLETEAGVSKEKVFNVHGKMTTISCHYCRKEESFATFVDHLRHKVKDITGEDTTAPDKTEPMLCTSCGREGMRPDVVLYGEALDDSYAASLTENSDMDLLLVVGTSLTVAPLSELPNEVPSTCYRMVISKMKVGEDVGLKYGRGRDIYVPDDCDAALAYLAHQLRWSEDLKGYADRMSSMSSVYLDTASLLSQEDVSKPGRRVELVVTCKEDLSRVMLHSREATVEVPKVEVDFSSHITAGRPITIGGFLAEHQKQVQENMQMIMGQGSQSAVREFLEGLSSLHREESMPWSILVDDPAGDVTISSRDGDTEQVLRVTKFSLTPKEKRLMGIL